MTNQVRTVSAKSAGRVVWMWWAAGIVSSVQDEMREAAASNWAWGM
jgi:hypothetical protein